MKAVKIVAVLLIVAGIAGLVFGKLTYTKITKEMDGDLFHYSVKETANEKKTIPIPVWVGITTIVAGGLLLVVAKRS
jgi:uncharacterized membrane protein